MGEERRAPPQAGSWRFHASDNELSSIGRSRVKKNSRIGEYRRVLEIQRRWIDHMVTLSAASGSLRLTGRRPHEGATIASATWWRLEMSAQIPFRAHFHMPLAGSGHAMFSALFGDAAIAAWPLRWDLAVAHG
jgi:hypothetical protein